MRFLFARYHINVPVVFTVTINFLATKQGRIYYIFKLHLSYIFRVPSVGNFITKIGLSDDSFWMIEQGIYFRFLPLLLFLLASGIVSFHCFIVEKGIIILSTTVGFIFGW